MSKLPRTGENTQWSVRSVEITEIGGLLHYVTLTAMARGVTEGKGWYLPLCGKRIHAAFMEVPPSRTCAHCASRIAPVIERPRIPRGPKRPVRTAKFYPPNSVENRFIVLLRRVFRKGAEAQDSGGRCGD